MTAPQLPEATIRYLAENSGSMAGQMLAAELLAARETTRELVDVLRRNGFRQCDVPACNCDSWHQVDGYAARFREIDEAIGDHDGKTLLTAVQEVLAERDAARAEVARVAKQRDEARSVAQHVVELIDDGGSSADVWNLCARWSYNWAGSEQPKPAGGA